MHASAVVVPNNRGEQDEWHTPKIFEKISKEIA
jgi:hypothetical protein